MTGLTFCRRTDLRIVSKRSGLGPRRHLCPETLFLRAQNLLAERATALQTERPRKKKIYSLRGPSWVPSRSRDRTPTGASTCLIASLDTRGHPIDWSPQIEGLIARSRFNCCGWSPPVGPASGIYSLLLMCSRRVASTHAQHVDFDDRDASVSSVSSLGFTKT